MIVYSVVFAGSCSVQGIGHETHIHPPVGGLTRYQTTARRGFGRSQFLYIIAHKMMLDNLDITHQTAS